MESFRPLVRAEAFAETSEAYCVERMRIFDKAVLPEFD